MRWDVERVEKLKRMKKRNDEDGDGGDEKRVNDCMQTKRNEIK